jgi:predicted outer membrane repeat protein
VVTVLGVTVSFEDLVIEGGVASRRAPRDGGGPTNRDGTLTLRDVLVRANRAKRGGGIFTTGSVTLEGATRITGNDADEGAGGVKVVGGSLTMNGSSTIDGNGASVAFAGVLLDGANLTLNDHSSIRGNRPSGVRARRPSGIVMNDHSSIRGNEPRGGVHLESGPSLTMNDSSTITRNTAGVVFEGREGGGIYVHKGTLVGVICAPRLDANVFKNSPDDCIRNGHPF